MNTFTLTVQMDRLHFPHGGDDWKGDGPTRYDCPEFPSMLICRHDSGDCDTCPWPMTSVYATVDQLRERLALALYDERESNPHWPNRPDVVILLPDGERFDFDDVLADRALRDATVTWTMGA